MLRTSAGRLRTLVLMIVLGAMAACSSMSRKPEVSLAGVELSGIGLVDQRFVIKLNVHNPNDIDLSLKALDFNVELDGKRFAHGVAAKPMIVPRQSDAVLEIQAVGSLVVLLQQLRELRKAGRETIPYRIFGVADADVVGALSFDRRGEVAFPSLAPERKGSRSGDRPL